MRMIPASINSLKVTKGERLLFNAFSCSLNTDKWYGLFDYRVFDSEGKILGQTDFLVIGPYGIFCLENKHWENVTVINGRWPDGKESPFEQVNRCMLDLRKKFRKEMEHLYPKIMFGNGVIFTLTDFLQKGPEWSLDLVLNPMHIFEANGDIKKDFLKPYLLRLKETWINREQENKSILTGEEIDSIKDYFWPKVNTAISLAANSYFTNEKLLELRDEQIRMFRGIKNNPKIICSGGAGSGKTTLAIACARECAKQGEKVLFVCFNPILASYLSASSKVDNIKVSSLYELFRSSLGNKLGYPSHPSYSDLKEEKFIKGLPKEVIVQLGKTPLLPIQQYDVLFMDEAQDCLNVESIEALGLFLRGGWKDGRWRLYMDDEHQAQITGFFDPEVLVLIEEGAIPYSLTENQRNSEVIAQKTVQLTKIKFFEEARVPGRDGDVEIIEYDNLISEILSTLEILMRQSVSKSKIALLSGRESLDSSVIKELKRRLPPDTVYLNHTTMVKFPISGITCSTIDQYKGLESDIVLLFEVEDVTENTLYVGMTRAKTKLYLYKKKS